MWYERKQPLKLRVWYGHSFEHDCSFVMGKEGIEVIGLTGTTKRMPQYRYGLAAWTGRDMRFLKGII